jgi:hypothetical protein
MPPARGIQQAVDISKRRCDMYLMYHLTARTTDSVHGNKGLFGNQTWVEVWVEVMIYKHYVMAGKYECSSFARLA